MSSNGQVHRWPVWLWGAALVMAIGSGLGVSAAIGSSGQENPVTDEPGGVSAGAPTQETSITDEPEAVAGGGLIPKIPGPSDPLLLDGRVVSQERASAIVGYPVVVPSDPLASESTLTEVWVQGEDAALRFSTGVRIYLARWPTGKDVGGSYARQVSEAGVGRVDTVAGHPVLIFPKDAQHVGAPPQSNVSVVVNGVQAEIWGDTSPDELLRIAANLVE
jgi:hypothetical protein